MRRTAEQARAEGRALEAAALEQIERDAGGSTTQTDTSQKAREVPENSDSSQGNDYYCAAPNGRGPGLTYTLWQAPLPALRVTQFCRTVGGRRHRLRSRKLKADPRKRGRPKPGGGLPWLRAYLTAIARGPKRNKSRWVEVDLNRVFNAAGYSLSWGRELFRRVQRDSFFRALVKVRFIQKRLLKTQCGVKKRGGNGCFVVLVALRRTLKWDKEPLFDCRDDQARHLRPALRSGDIDREELAEAQKRGTTPNDATARLNSQAKDCPAPSSTILPVGTAVQKTRAQAPDSIDPAQAGSDWSTAAAQVSEPQQDTNLRLSCKNTAPTMPNGSESAKFKKGKTAVFPPVQPGRSAIDRLSFDGLRRLQRLALWLCLQCRARHWDNCKVRFRWDHAYTFTLSGLIDGQPKHLLLAAWDYGVHQAHADAVDSDTGGTPLKRDTAAPASLAHARRWLKERTRGGRWDRVKLVYHALKKVAEKC